MILGWKVATASRRTRAISEVSGRWIKFKETRARRLETRRSEAWTTAERFTGSIREPY